MATMVKKARTTRTRPSQRSAAKPAAAKTTRRREFDGDDANSWRELPSSSMYWTLAIAAYEGAVFPGSELLSSRIKAKELIAELKEQGYGKR